MSTHLLKLVTKSGVYAIQNTVTGKVYIGSAVDLRERKKFHFWSLANNTHHSAKLQRAWNKYKPWDFIFRPLIYCNRDSLIKFEQIAIDGVKNTVGWDMMYNISPTAGSSLGSKRPFKTPGPMLGRKHKPESIEAMRKSHTGRVHSPESIAKIVASNTGQTRTLEFKQRLREVALARPPQQRTPEWNAKISAAHKGKVKPQEQIDKQAAKLRGRKQSPELIEKRIAPLRGRPQDREFVARRIEGTKKGLAIYWASEKGLTRKKEIAEKQRKNQAGNKGRFKTREEITGSKKPWEVD